MKKAICVFLVSAIASLAANAQTEKGYMMAGGQFANLHADKQSFSIAITPSFAWFLAKNVAVGATVKLGYSKPEDADGTVAYGVLPTLRYYFAGNEKNKVFGQFRTGIEGITTDNEGMSAWLTDLGLGYNHFITKNIALELGVSYGIGQLGDAGGDRGVDLNFGLQVFLPAKRAGK